MVLKCYVRVWEESLKIFSEICKVVTLLKSNIMVCSDNLSKLLILIIQIDGENYKRDLSVLECILAYTEKIHQRHVTT